PGDTVLHRADEIEVEGPRKIRVDPALHADLRRASPPGLLGLVRYVAQRERVGLGVDLALREGAEPAPHVTDVREVDVAVHDVRNLRADGFGAELVGDP